MNNDINSPQPQQPITPPNQTPLQPPAPTPGPQPAMPNIGQPTAPEPNFQPMTPKPSKKKKKILIIVLVLLLGLIVGGVIAWQAGLFSKAEPEAQTSQAPEQVAVQATVIYQVGNKVIERNLDTGKETEILTNATSADLSPDKKQIAYINTKSELVVRGYPDGTDSVLIKNTAEEKGGLGTIYTVENKSGEELKTSGLAEPEWSADAKYIGLDTGSTVGEGGSSAVLELSTNKYLDLGDTFRYVNEDVPKAGKFTFNQDTERLKTLKLHPLLLFNEWGAINAAVFAPDKNIVYANLCEQQAIFDCQSGEVKTKAVSIDLSSGAYTALATTKNSNTSASMLVVGGSLYYTDVKLDNEKGGLQKPYTVTGIDIEAKTAKDYSLDKLIPAGADVQDIALMSNGDNVFASVKVKKGEKQFEYLIIDVLGEKQITKIDSTDESWRGLDILSINAGAAGSPSL